MQGKLHRIQEGKFRKAAYYTIGKGNPVILLHGFPADHQLWRNQIPILQEEYQLILPDIPGSGLSPIIEKISIADIGDFIKAILEQEKIETCVLIGHSMGGYATLSFAQKYPKCLRGWGLIHSSAFADNEERKKGRKRSIALMKKYGQDQFIKQMLPNLFSKKTRSEDRKKVQALIQRRIKAGVDALIPYYHAMWERPERTQVLREAEVPVLFIIGKEDTAAPLSDLLQQVSLPKISQIHILEKVGHLAMIEAPSISTKILQEFLAFCHDY